MRMTQWIQAALCTAVLATALPIPALGQFGGLRRKAEEAAKKKVGKAEDEAVKKAEAAAEGAVTDSGSSAAAATPQSGGGGGAANAAPVSAKVWENYDFVPGNKILFYTDFSEDKVGNFARGLRYKSGPAEVVERDGVKVLRATGKSVFLIPIGRKLPERFTLEFDVIGPTACCHNTVLVFEGGTTLDRGAASAEVTWAPHGTFIIGSGQDAATSPVKIPDAAQQALRGNVAHVRVLMDSAYFKMYTNERRMYNNSNLSFKRDSVIRVQFEGTEVDGGASYLTRIRVAESETDVLYDALAAKGRWATQGILFATGKADLQPESRPVLKEIAATLVKYPELKVLIEGHTDNVGSAPSNLTLSDARAAAVKAALVSQFEIAEGRITTKGMGDTKPTVPNATASGRAQNRRVEVVKL